MSSLSLPEICKKKYDDMIMEGWSNIDPLVLPPSPRAVVYHGLRFYRQIKVWLLLMNTDELGLENEEWLVFTYNDGCRARSTRSFGNDTMQLKRILWQTVLVSKGWLGMLQLVRWMSSCFCDNAMNEQNIDDEIEDYFPGTFQMRLIKNSKLFSVH